MEQEVYERIEKNEEAYWWNLGRKNIFIDTLSRFANKDDVILDMGCGSGYFLSEARDVGFYNLTGVESYDYDFKFDNIIKTDIRNTSIDSSSTDIIVSFDVLEHIEIEKKFVSEIHRILKDDAMLILTVPANQWMYGEHDKSCHHYRRYSKKTLSKVLIDNGFKIEKISYFNTFLFPLAVAVRFVEKIIKTSTASKHNTGGGLNSLFYKIFNLEKYFLRFCNFPFGLSLIVIAKK